MHHLPTSPGLLVIAGLACWFLGCLAFAAAGITRYAETRRTIRARRQP